MASAASLRKVREPEYARRLAQACEANPHCPDPKRGGLTWLADQLGKKVGKKLAPQTVANWINGWQKPRTATNEIIAEILGVDSVWLFLGVKQQNKIKSNKHADEVVEAALCLLELHEAKGTASSPSAARLQQAIERYQSAA